MPPNALITALFVLLLGLIVYAVILVMPASMTMTVVLLLALLVLAAIVYVIHQRVQKIVKWILGTPMGQPGQAAGGVAIWIKMSSFARGATVSGSDPDGTKPVDPPPDL